MVWISLPENIFFFSRLPEEDVQQLSQQTVSTIERSGGSFANGLQQAGLPTESVQASRLFQRLVNAPPALLRSRIIDPRNGEICRVRWQVVHDLGEHTDDYALAVQLQRRSQSQDQLPKIIKDLYKFNNILHLYRRIRIYIPKFCGKKFSFENESIDIESISIRNIFREVEKKKKNLWNIYNIYVSRHISRFHGTRLRPRNIFERNPSVRARRFDRGNSLLHRLFMRTRSPKRKLDELRRDQVKILVSGFQETDPWKSPPRYLFLRVSVSTCGRNNWQKGKALIVGATRFPAANFNT